MGLFSSKTKTKSSFEPWAPAKDYLLGNEEDGTKGIFPEAGKLYEQGGFNPQMQGGMDKYLQQIQGRQGQYGDIGAAGDIYNPAFGGASEYKPTLQKDVSGFVNKAANDMAGGAYNVANGNYDTNYRPAAGVTAQSVNLQNARQGQGQLDPTKSLSGLLSGNVNNPYLQQQASAMTRNLTRNLNENVMPGLRSEALASGQYGGSRQGIAEGLAASRLNQDLAPALTSMFGGAHENAQQRMYGAATGLNEQAGNNATNNANRQLQADQFNSNLELQNNDQQINQNTGNLNNRMKSMDIANNALGLLSGNQRLQAGNQDLITRGHDITRGMQGIQSGIQGLQSGAQQLQLGGQQVQANRNNFQDQDFDSYMNSLSMPQNMDWQNLQNYQNTIYPGAQLGGSSKSKTTSSPSTMGAIMGTAAGIGGIASGVTKAGGLGKMFSGFNFGGS